MKLLALTLPDYRVDREPDYKAIGGRIDEVVKHHCMGREILLRGLGSQEHPGKTVDELVDIVATTGTDRYDPQRTGDRYVNIEGKHIDIFAFAATVTPTLKLGWQVIYGFYHSAIGVHGRPVRVDILTIYDAVQLTMVEHHYAGRDDVKRDGFVFNHPGSKQTAVLGIIKLT